MPAQIFTDLGNGTVLHETKNHLRIDAVWAFVSVDENGDEGLVAAPLPGFGLTPLIAADEKRLNSLIPLAESIAAKTKMTIKLIRLGTREEVRVIEPKA